MHAPTDQPVAHHPQIEHAGSEREAAPREVALERRAVAAHGVQRESRPAVGREIAPHRARKVSGTAAHQDDDDGGLLVTRRADAKPVPVSNRSLRLRTYWPHAYFLKKP